MCDESLLTEVVERVENLEAQLEAKDERIEQLEETVEEQEARIDELESWQNAARKKFQCLHGATAELQTRELEKGAHLPAYTLHNSFGVENHGEGFEPHPLSDRNPEILGSNGEISLRE